MLRHKSNLIGILTFLFFISLAQGVAAADLSIVVSPSQPKIGDTVTATVYVNSGGKAINSVEAAISVPSDVLEIGSVSQSGSILTLWVEQPSFGNGTVSLSGGVTNPGYTGASGKVATFYMKALKAGTAPISFKSGSVRANDGLGTDVTNGRSGATVVVASSVPVAPVVVPTAPVSPTVPMPVPAPTAPAKKPDAPVVTSDSMPDAEAWYKDASTTLAWNIPPGVTAVRTYLGSNPDSDPTTAQTLSIKTKMIEGLTEGTTYFNIKFQSSAGWSPITSRKIQVDATSPDVPSPEYRILDSGRVVAEFDARDGVSGVARAVLTVPGEMPIDIDSIPEDGRVQVVFPQSYSGTKDVTIEVFDRAGNSSVARITIDFPAKGTVSEEQSAQFALGPLLNKVVSAFVSVATATLQVASRLDPLTVLVCALFVLVSLGLYKVIQVYQYRKRYESLFDIRNDVNSMMDIVRRNMSKVMRVILTDKSIKDIGVAEDILASSIMDDVRDIEKALKAKDEMRKRDRKNMR